jgi:photosystem II stability/assembly factor-like uncharacterized protein
MKQIKLLIFILLSITILSCDSINKPEDDGLSWEFASRLPDLTYVITVASNGDIWVGNYYRETSLSALYLSTDNGDTWVLKSKLTFTLMSLAISPVNGYIFAGSDLNGLFRSIDNGESWVQITDHQHIHEILVTESGEIYLGTHGKVYYSNDNGDTWIEKSHGLPSEYLISLALGTDGTLYVATYSRGVYRLTSGTDTWMPPTNYADVLVRALTISDDGSIFAAVWGGAVLKSTDGGINWTELSILPNIDYSNANKVIYNPITKDLFVTCQLLNLNTGYINSEYNQIYRSTNLGASWSWKSGGLPNDQWLLIFGFNSNTGQMYITTNDELYRSVQ